ncbi:hypothetical protein [Kribbella sp. NBC_00889]|uniref:NucA/NucB deoxyribonuclease domain-containing protein n=1 Tax=Kribbella sp. NBC_00889 TaxID=2975974 RepID=UPI00386E4393|nr:NucA/NucB deoxyribonuclease domain-containing protein [Kribbella sp. NBC_00889]
MKRLRLNVAVSVGAAVVGLLSSLGAASNPTPTPAPPAAGSKIAADDAPRPYDDFKFIDKDECQKQTAGANVESGELRGYAVNHFQWCAWRFVLLPLKDDSGRIINIMSYRLTVMAQGREDDRYVTTTHYVDKIHYRYFTGFGPGNTTLKVTPTCTLNNLQGACVYSPDPAGPASLKDIEDNPLEITMRSDQAVDPATNPLAIMQGMMTFTQSYATSAGGGTLTMGVLRAGQIVRCDSAQLEQTAYLTPACIFINANPVLNFNINDANINESALHIRDAQNYPQEMFPKPPDNVSKTMPSPLTRHWDQVLNDQQRNRSIATCLAAFGPNPGGVDCDEYPFASTLEGSLGTPGPGQEQNYNFSVRYIDYRDNRRAGRWLQLWYYKDRILSGDKFTVNIFDGPVVTAEDPVPPSGSAGDK